MIDIDALIARASTARDDWRAGRPPPIPLLEAIMSDAATALAEIGQRVKSGDGRWVRRVVAHSVEYERDVWRVRWSYDMAARILTGCRLITDARPQPQT
jgi:hypothetical protein